MKKRSPEEFLEDGHTECFKYARLLDICEFVDDLVENKWGLSTLI